MPWYSMSDTQKAAQSPAAANWPTLGDALKMAREAGAWEPMGLPTDWEAGDLVLTRAQLFALARVIAAEAASRTKKPASLPQAACSWYDGLTWNEFGGYYEGDAWAARGDEMERRELQEEREHAKACDAETKE